MIYRYINISQHALIILVLNVDTRNENLARTTAPILDCGQLFLKQSKFQKMKIEHSMGVIEPTIPRLHTECSNC